MASPKLTHLLHTQQTHNWCESVLPPNTMDSLPLPVPVGSPPWIWERVREVIQETYQSHRQEMGQCPTGC